MYTIFIYRVCKIRIVCKWDIIEGNPSGTLKCNKNSILSELLHQVSFPVCVFTYTYIQYKNIFSWNWLMWKYFVQRKRYSLYIGLPKHIYNIKNKIRKNLFVGVNCSEGMKHQMALISATGHTHSLSVMCVGFWYYIKLV